MWNKSERDGKLEQAKGRVKQAVGGLVGSAKLKTDGEVDEAVGTARAAVGVAEKKVGVAMKSIRRAAKR